MDSFIRSNFNLYFVFPNNFRQKAAETYEADELTVATDLATGYKVIVTAQDGITTKTYVITLTAASTDATLSDIRIDGGFLSGFDSAAPGENQYFLK